MRGARRLAPILLAAAVPLAVAAEPAPAFVSTAWLSEHLSDPDLMILDARPSLRDYLREHLPGAQPLAVESLRAASGGVPAEILPPEAVAALLSRLGLSGGSRVVVYSEATDPDAALVATVLRLSGVSRTSILDGGWARWNQETRPVTSERRRVARVTPMPARPFQELAGLEEVRRSLGQGAAVLLDVRDAEQFAAGHIPGALHRHWKQDLAQTQGPGAGLIRPAADLEKEYAALGIPKDRPVIVYCNSGHMAAEGFYVLRHLLGHPDVRLYDGSWLEWGAQPDTPKQAGLPAKAP